MKNFFSILAYLLPIFLFSEHTNAAIVTNKNIQSPCQLHIQYQSGQTATHDTPSLGQSTEIDLIDQKIIRMQCDAYRGKGTQKIFCVVPTGRTIETVTLFNEPDPFGDYPACKAR